MANFESMQPGSYQTIGSPASGLYKEKGSKFIAYAYPVSSEEEVKDHLEQLRKEHPKARHYCYAYRINTDGSLYRANDDGEPSATAGKPILGQLLSFEVTDTLIVVVRYFGGTKLGASGLIQAYKTAAHDALMQAEIVTRIVMTPFQIQFPYAVSGEIMQSLARIHASTLAEKYTDRGLIEFELPLAEADQRIHQMKSHLAGFDGMAEDMDQKLVEKGIFLASADKDEGK